VSYVADWVAGRREADLTVAAILTIAFFASMICPAIAVALVVNDGAPARAGNGVAPAAGGDR
jgi:hypothetical protein